MVDCPEEQTAPPPSRELFTPTRYESRTIGSTPTGPRYVGRAIDLDLKDADLHNVFRLLADVGNVNIVIGDGVQGQVTLSMRHVPWDQVLDSVVAAKGLRMEREGNVIMIFAK